MGLGWQSFASNIAQALKKASSDTQKAGIKQLYNEYRENAKWSANIRYSAKLTLRPYDLQVLTLIYQPVKGQGIDDLAFDFRVLDEASLVSSCEDELERHSSIDYSWGLWREGRDIAQTPLAHQERQEPLRQEKSSRTEARLL